MIPINIRAKPTRTASLYRASMRDFLLREHHFETRTPQRVSQLAQLAYDIALRAAPHPSTTDAA